MNKKSRSRSPHKSDIKRPTDLTIIDQLLKDKTPIISKDINKLGYYIQIRSTDYSSAKYSFKQLASFCNFLHIFKSSNQQNINASSFYESLIAWTLFTKQFGPLYNEKLNECFWQAKQIKVPEVTVKPVEDQSTMQLDDDTLMSMIQLQQPVQETSQSSQPIKTVQEPNFPDAAAMTEQGGIKNFIYYIQFEFITQYMRPGLQYAQTLHKQRFEIKVEIPRQKPWETKCTIQFDPKEWRQNVYSNQQCAAMQVLESNPSAANFFAIRYLGAFHDVAHRDLVLSKSTLSSNQAVPPRQIINEHIVYSHGELPDWFALNKHLSNVMSAPGSNF